MYSTVQHVQYSMYNKHMESLFKPLFGYGSSLDLATEAVFWIRIRNMGGLQDSDPHGGFTVVLDPGTRLN